MEVFTSSTVQYAEQSCHPQEKSDMEFMHKGESNCVEQNQVSQDEKKGDDTVSHLEETINRSLDNGQEPDLALERTNGVSSFCEIDENDQKSGDHHDKEDDNLVEHGIYKETCLDFQNSHVVVDTIESEPLWENKEEDLPASRWPEHDEALALWVKWRGQWQAGIKCARADWPLATVRAKPTHDRKNYIVIFFPHSRNYSWVDTLLVCSIDEFPQPIAHRSREVGVQLVEDLTVARRFIMKKLVIGVLNIVDQLSIKVLVETARDMAVWRDFAMEASGCKGYPDLGRLLLKFQNMIMQQYIDGNWLQHSLHQWTEKCQRAVSADTIEILKEEFVESILWNEVNTVRDAQGQPGLGSEWKVWKHDALKCFPSVSGGADVEQSKKDGAELQCIDSPLTTSLPISHKRPKLEVRRAEQHTSHVENKCSHDNTVHQIDSSFPAVQRSISNDNSALETSKEELSMQGTVPLTIPANDVDRWDDVTVSDTNIESAPSKSVELQPNGVEETKSLTSKYRNRQCVAFVECKGRRCGRWANEGDDYCCVHVPSRFPKTSIQTVVTPPDDTPMCQGTTNTGTRCKHRSLPGSSFCKKHRSRGDCVKSPSSPGSQLKRKLDVLLDQSEYNNCKDVVVSGEAQRPPEEQPVKVTITEDNTFSGGNSLIRMPEHFSEDSSAKITELSCCIGLGVNEAGALCLESPNRHSLYCEKHVPSWLKRARNGKSRIISKEVFLNLLKECSAQREKVYLHQACELFYKLFKSILSVRNQVPKEIQFQWIMSEAKKDSHVAEFIMKLVCSEKERLRRIWGFDVSKDAIVSPSLLEEQAIVPVEECGYDGTLKCKICSEDFGDDQTLGAHWIKNHNKEAQWLFRGYACAICLDSFTNKKVLETHVQERHHAQFVEHCMLIQCIPCGSHFGNSDELWSHVLSVHTEGFRQSKAGAPCHLLVSSHQKNVSSNAASTENNSESQSTTRKFVCRFCGLKFDLLPDLGRHHQAAHMGPSLLGSRPKKKGLSFYSYRLKSGRLSRPRFKKGLSGASYRLGNKGGIMLKKRIQSVNALGAGAGGISVQSHVMDTARLIRLSEAQCWDIAKMLWSEARKTKARPNNHEILSIARSACCKVSLQKTLEQKYGLMPERLYLRAAKLCSDNNIQVAWHQEGFRCLNGCKLIEDQMLVPVLSSPPNDHTRLRVPSSDPQPGEWEMDECHYVIHSRHLRHQSLKTTIILCDDISFGQETVPVSCVVDKNLLNSLHVPTVGFDGRVVFMPWDSFTYVAKPHLDQSFHISMQLGCGCEGTTCSPETCDHVYLFNTDYENAKGLDGKPMDGRFAYDNYGRIIVESGCLVYECNHLCKCSSNCPNRVLQNGVKVKLEVFRTEKGWGVRAGENILRGTFVCEFVGEVLDVQEAEKRRQRYGEEGHSYFYDVGPHMQLMSDLMEGQTKYVVDATKYGNVSRFVNHSSSANLVSHLVLVESMDFQLAHIGLYAKQDICAGEELTLDYCYQL